MSKPSPAVAAAIAANKSKPKSEDRLEAVRNAAKQARDLECEIADLTSIIKVKSEELRTLYQNTIPDLMDDAQVDIIGIPPAGNLPGIDYRLVPYFRAGIAASWPNEKREAAFELLKKLGVEELIKTEVSVRLPKGKLAIAKKIMAAAKALHATPELKKTVHTNTLTAWLRSFYLDDKKALPASDLEKIGASVGRVVEPKERKD